jgi:hypothetical protein
LAGALALALAGATCPGTQTETPAPNNDPVITVVEPTLPTGTVGGLVLDFANGNPLPGVDVKLTAGNKTLTATTDASGVFGFEGVPAGGVVHLRLTLAQYQGADLDVPLDDAAGNFPSNSANAHVGPVALIKAGTSPPRVTVYGPDGTPAQGARILADLPVRFVTYGADGMPQARGQTHVDGNADATGTLALATLPDPAVLATRFPAMSLTITVAAFGTAENGSALAAGTTRVVTLQELLVGNNQVVIGLGPFENDELRIIASNLPDLVTGRVVQFPGEIPPSGTTEDSVLRVVFNQPVLIDYDGVVAVMVAEDGHPLPGLVDVAKLEILNDLGASAYGSVVELRLPAAPGGIEGNLSLRATTGHQGDRSLSTVAPVYFSPTEYTLRVLSMTQTEVRAADGFLGSMETAELVLNRAVGAREAATGQPVSSGAMMPITVTLQRPGALVVTSGRLCEPLPGSPYRPGGYTTRVCFRMPDNLEDDFRLPATTAVAVRVVFNDAVRRDGGVPGGGERAAVPFGDPASEATESLTVRLMDADTTGGGG